MDRILVLDFGGQYAHLIANRLRRLKVLAEIVPGETKAEKLAGAKGLILSGGPASVYEEGSPQPDPAIFELKMPILGLCYGHQLIAKYLKGKVTPGSRKEYGKAELKVNDCTLFEDLSDTEQVWMSHGDLVEEVPEGFEIIGSTEDCKIAAMASDRIFGLQFHPEVTHTPNGMKILDNFIRMTGCRREWSMHSFLKEKIHELSRMEDDIFLLVSGGVDSTVCYALLKKAGCTVKGLHIDNGLLRMDESKEVLKAMPEIDFFDASEDFLEALKDVANPEEKRRIIGDKFVHVAEKAMKDMNADGWLLAQGTIYPDTIESRGTSHSALIKTHHNRVPLMQELIRQGKVIEPISQLYKDEVRELGLKLGLPHSMVWRHPFPGPGLAVRCLCSGHELEGFKHEDNALISRLAAPLKAVIAPVSSVGVQGDARTYRHPAIVYGKADWEALDSISHLPNKLGSINRVMYMVSDGEPQLDLHRAFITKKRLSLLRKVDKFVNSNVKDKDIWQFPVILIPMGGDYGESIILRPVMSREAMTATYAKLPLEDMRRLAKEIQAMGVDCVYYDITTKPPGTIEWE